MANIRLSFIVIALVTLVGCDNAEKKGLAFIAQQTKDPDSAKFQDVHVVPSPNSEREVHVCGVVNAKNVFGAYTGGTRFIARVAKDDDKYETTGFALEGTDEKSRRATVETINTDKPQSEFEYKYWNKLCINNQTKPTYSGSKWETPFDLCAKEIVSKLNPTKPIPVVKAHTSNGTTVLRWGDETAIMLPASGDDFLIGHVVTCIVDNDLERVTDFYSN